MRALLHDLHLSLDSDDPLVIEGWQKLFDVEAEAASSLSADVSPDITLTATAVSIIPAPPNGRPSYVDPVPEQGRRVRYYDRPSGGILDLARPTQIHFDFDVNHASIYLTQTIVDTGNLEDITMIALAPFLRRRGFYMAHAFAVSDESAVLLSGPTGSGKTTTGLAMVQAGANYLANDVTLLRRDDVAINAYLSPGGVNLHPNTLALLPGYEELFQPEEKAEGRGKFILSRGSLLDGEQLGQPSPVSTILFPSITEQKSPSLHEVPRAIGMARLVEEGVDQWDEATYDDHLNFLAALSSQARFYDLRIPKGGPADLRSVAGQLVRELQ